MSPDMKGYPRPAGSLDKKGKSQFIKDSTEDKTNQKLGLGKSFTVKRKPSS